MPDRSSTRLSLRPHQLANAVIPVFLAVLGVYLTLKLFWISSNFLVLTCAAALAALALNRVALAATHRFGVPRKVGVIAIMALLVGGAAAGAYFAGTQVASQYAELGKALPDAVNGLRDSLLAGPLGSYLEPALNQPNGGLDPTKVLGNFSGWFGTVVGAVSSLFFFLAVTLYLAVQPNLYIDGFLKLLKTESRQQRARQVMGELYDRLWKFLMAAAMEMTLVGVVSTLGLWALGIPYAVALGLTAGLLCFIPVIGPALSFIPALLVGLSQGSDEALAVTGLFAAIQLVESNLITPVIQEKLADVPPVLLLLGQAVAGLLFGFMGIALAAPGVVALMVLVEQFHLRPRNKPAAEVAVGVVEGDAKPTRIPRHILSSPFA